jgi:glycosyltransferase involved in cell wall biosynthesis
MKIAFHINHFTFRGTEVAVFDYAFYNQEILNNTSIIVVPVKQSIEANQLVYQKFEKEFKIVYYSDIDDLESICYEKEKVDALYIIKYGTNDGLFLKKTPTWIHCVFTTEEPHGDLYVGVSESVSKKNKDNILHPFLNHIVYLPDVKSDYRKELGIPSSALVLGRHGGLDTFNIEGVGDVIINILNERNDIWFLFCGGGSRLPMFKDVSHSRLLFLDTFVDTRIKRKFINTCDAMIHACDLGESFGLSILEFSFCNKPVITWNGGLWHKQHISNLGDKAILYDDQIGLHIILRDLKHSTINNNNNNKYYNVTDNFTPVKIMKQFNDIFINTFKKDKN